MEKIQRLRTGFKQEKEKLRKLEDDYECVLDLRLKEDTGIQSSNDVKERKNPKYISSLLK